MGSRIRSLTHRDDFLEGNRQKWALVFLIASGITMFAEAFWHINPTPYLTLYTFLGSFIIGGNTATEWVKTKALSAESTRNDQNQSQYTKDEKIITVTNIDIKESIVEQDGKEAPTIRPFTQVQDPGDNLPAVPQEITTNGGKIG